MDLDDDWEEWDPRKGSFIHHMIAGSAAGVSEHLLMFPFDTYKTHAQFARNAGGVPSFAAMLREVGFLRMWRGSPAVLLACIPSHAAYFSAYEAAKEAASGSGPLAPAAAGAAATLLHDAILTPADVLKQRLQLGYYNGLLHAAVTVVREEGVKALFKSYPTVVAMNIPYAATVVTVNEALKSALGADERPSLLKFMAAGAGAGAVAAIVTCPLDVVKTRLQTAALACAATPTGAAACSTPTPRRSWSRPAPGATGLRPQIAQLYTAPDSSSGALGIARGMLANEGFKSFFKGVRARVIVHTPSMAISWGTYEVVKQALVRAWPTDGGGVSTMR